MKNILQQAGYVLNPDTSTWSRSEYGGIQYSDGTDAENRIAAMVAQSQDLSVLSSELKVLCTDWPSTYHLSANRANVLRPFSHLLAEADVLEIGAGCGAITRYLGECRANVLALEGSSRRAAIARDRTRELPNVEVLAERFDQFQTPARFDIVTLIGVLEYASMFTSSDEPAKAMLRAARALLKPTGVLIIAIENQLGLKYFAGAPEDHLWVPMYGVEGRYRNGEPQTFGRIALTELIATAGFHHSDFLAPFPDYKLPVSIITEAGFLAKEFSHSALAIQTVRRDPQLPDTLGFSPELAWPVVAQNQLALDLANSFVVLAHNNAATDARPQVLAYHYSTNRRPAYCKETTFQQALSGQIEAHYKLLSPQSDRSDDSYIRFRIPQKSDYVLGQPLAEKLLKIVTREGWSAEELAKLLLDYLEMLNQLGHLNLDLSSITLETRLPGEYVDLLPQNIIVRADGSAAFIDKEWEATSDIPLGWLLFRCLLLLVQSVSRFGRSTSHFKDSRSGFITAVLHAMQLPVNAEDLQAYGQREAELQSAVIGLPIETRNNWGADAPLPWHNLSSKLDASSAELAANSAYISQLQNNIANAFAQVHQKNQELHHLRSAWQDARSAKGAINNLVHATLNRIGLHRIKQQRIRNELQRSGQFDARYYLATYPDVAAAKIDPLQHYIQIGAREGRNPSPTFNSAGYMERYADVRALSLNPLLHYLRHGRQEGRDASFPDTPMS